MAAGKNTQCYIHLYLKLGLRKIGCEFSPLTPLVLVITVSLFSSFHRWTSSNQRHDLPLCAENLLIM